MMTAMVIDPHQLQHMDAQQLRALAEGLMAKLKRPGFRGGSNTGEWSHEEVLEVFA